MRRNILFVHLFLAAFIAPALLLVATSGGLYLLGIKGKVETAQISLPEDAQLDFSAATLEPDIIALLGKIGLDHPYEYLKNGGTVVQTRPTSRTYLEFKHKEGVLQLNQNKPDLQAAMMELHKGHGPTAFKTYQKLVAVSLLIIVLSGLWMGLSSPALKRKTQTTFGIGVLVFLLLILS